MKRFKSECTCWQNTKDGRLCKFKFDLNCPTHGEPSPEGEAFQNLTMYDRAKVISRIPFNFTVDDRFLIQIGLAPSDHGVIVNCLNVPSGVRSEGWGREIMKRFLVQCDMAKVPSILLPCADNGLPQDKLESWYWRLGYRPLTLSCFKYTPLDKVYTTAALRDYWGRLPVTVSKPITSAIL